MNHDEAGKLPHYVKQTIDRLLIENGGPRPLTYQELAEKMGMDPGQLSKVMSRHQRVRLDTLERIAEALNVSLSTLFAEPAYARVYTRAELVTLLQRSYDAVLEAHDALVAGVVQTPESEAKRLHREQDGARPQKQRHVTRRA